MPQKLLFHHKPIRSGFIVLCHDCSYKQVKITVNSIKNNYPKSKCCCVVPQDCDEEEIAKLCPTYKACGTIPSLINKGLEHAPCNDWNFIVIAGSWIRIGLDRKYSCFIEGKKDILFPIVNRQMNFSDGSINGILMQKKALKDIGPLDADQPLEVCKMFWALAAVDSGYRFKAILGTAIVKSCHR